jgi:hypothetical protein
MRTLLVSALLLTSSAFAQDAVELRLQELEGRMAAMETLVKEKLGDCQMTYRHHSVRLNNCDRGTFAHAAMQVASGVMQLECGYYQLQCSRND